MSKAYARNAAEKAFEYLRKCHRIKIADLKDNPGARTKGRQVLAVHNKAGQSHKELQVGAKPPLGWIYGDFFKPWTQIWPGEPYNRDIHLRREYPPLSLLELQRLIDLGWIDITQPIDLTTLCRTRQYKVDPIQRQFGVQLTDEGHEAFKAKVNIEVQWASELTIATIERNGGVITTAYYDPASLVAVTDPIKFFEKGEPIPKRGFPPMDLMKYYIDASNRGYLADPAKAPQARLELAQKYGYELPDVSKDSDCEMLTMRKDPLQIFYGLEPGWVVNLHDKCVLKPLDEKLIKYYNS